LKNLSLGPCGYPIPPGRAGPAASSESCVAVGRTTLRSVDSQVKGRVIEPRKLKTRGAFVVDIGGGRVRRATLGPTKRVGSCRGRRARTMTARVPQELGRPRRLHRQCGPGDRTPNSQAPGGTPTTAGSESR